MIRSALSVLLLVTFPGFAQTTSELLQRGIFAQDTEGNLDNAILIYRQIVNSAPAQRDLAAQTQYRLAQALLQKGDLATAAKEFETLARNYSDYANLVSSLAAQMRPTPAGGGGRGGRGPGSAQLAQALDQVTSLERQAKLVELQARLAELRTKYSDGHPDVVRLQQQMDDLKTGAALTLQSQALLGTEFDQSKPISLRGTVSLLIWTNPRSWMKLDTSNGQYTLMLGAPNTMIQTGKMTRDNFKPGMTVSVTGILAKDGSMTVRADTISSEGRLIFDRATLGQQ